jgi:hypothetical protein
MIKNGGGEFTGVLSAQGAQAHAPRQIRAPVVGQKPAAGSKRRADVAAGQGIAGAQRAAIQSAEARA